ncbi:MAG: hypothetical protein ACRECX_14900 [Methyloceanibacter sp.]|uniref:hypothetical protein n=1 Tax=Methyloceanibacter sp. TaxID=1965321 RepID=UPI003D6C8ADD
MADPRDTLKKLPLEPHPEVGEVFADTMGVSFFDGSTLRLEFAASRMSEPKADKTPTGARHVVCRLVLPAPCAVDLFNQLQQIMRQLAQSGVVKMEQNVLDWQNLC